MTEGVFSYGRSCDAIKFSRPGYNEFVLERNGLSGFASTQEVLTVPRHGKAVLTLNAPDSYGRLVFYLTREATEGLFTDLERRHNALQERDQHNGAGGVLRQADAHELMQFFGEFSYRLNQRAERFPLAR